ncbi:SufS family cysteine desulfurase [Megasphaera butyrica]|jgi:cysteine desulfurase/selenocysteine lyase|uniref:aminotransferase class V-fold PLP-dependent enzyme n=1 Tax=Megasphaera TaxID=906 RepID=UPI0008210067|nr:MULTISPECIES: SufS family cysteine desulfurase [Megasphaera]MCU6714549.1 SufS family cysteine desulfurase [Megasphaera butyrica]MDN0047603.1 SufS family cysteine desulfurase [Megasphaera hexanoica]SCH62816.1 Probable cysteine desulfurase [uncultured Megasphaera sp.]
MLNVRNDFPILTKRHNGHQLVYLDNAATTQKPRQVIQAVVDFLENHNGNPHRGAHILSVEASEAYDQAREAVRRFINARSGEEVIFVRNATEGMNLIARSYGETHLQKGDKIVIPISEHHANLVTWQRVCRVTGAELVYMYLDETGHFTEDDLAKIDRSAKIVAFAGVSNVLGMKVPAEKIIERAHAVGAVVVYDGAQAVPHMKVDVQALDCDFMVFSGHKMLGSAGTGVVYGKKELLNDMEPFLLGGDMIEYVQEQTTTFNVLPFKFEAGTENVEGAVALHAAIEYLERLGWEAIEEHEHALVVRALEGMKKIPHIRIIGSTDPEEKTGVIAFMIDGVHPHDAATILDSYGIAIRSGHHCAQPFGAHIGAEASNRISFYIYNTIEEVDYFLETLPLVRRQMGYKD